MTDWIDKLTELRRRREAGEIDAAEFTAGRAAILAEQEAARATRQEVSPPSPPPSGFAASPASAPPQGQSAPVHRIAPIPTSFSEGIRNSSEPSVHPMSPPTEASYAASAPPKTHMAPRNAMAVWGLFVVLAIFSAFMIFRSPARMEGQAETVYVRGGTPLYSRPDLSKETGRSVSRGDALTVRMGTERDIGAQWARIAEAPWKGWYIQADRVSTTPRPDLEGWDGAAEFAADAASAAPDAAAFAAAVATAATAGTSAIKAAH